MKPKHSLSASAFSCRRLCPIFSVAVAVILSAFPAAAGQNTVKIGIVDLSKVVENLHSWRDTKTSLSAQDEKAEKLLAEQKKELQRIQDELDYFKPGSTGHQKRRSELAARRRELAELSSRLRQSLVDLAEGSLEDARKNVEKAVRDYAAANDFDVVVDARAVLYVAGGRDISLKVAQEMNNRYKEVQAKDKSERPKGK